MINSLNSFLKEYLIKQFRSLFEMLFFEVNLPVISNAECMRWFAASGAKQFVPDYTFLCAG